MYIKSILSFFQVSIITGICCLCLASCQNTAMKNDSPLPQPNALNTDSFLYAQALTESSYNWYQQTDSIMRSSAQSPHSKYFRVRFNTIAKNKLSQDGRLPTGNFFDEGALIIKELYDTIGAPLKYLAVMYKDKGNTNQAQGWVWLEIKGNGDKYISSDEKGAQCVSCHSSGRDYTRLFDIF